MPHLRSSTRTSALIVGALVCLLGGCIVTQDSPAPGCVKSIGLPVAGGCFGKTTLLDLQVAPATECLDLTINNCNGGVLEVRNTCAETLRLGGIEILPSDTASLDLTVDAAGTHTLIRTGGNFSDYIPDKDQHISFDGTLGTQAIAVTLTKTAQLCE
jgi:hypothetical protein